MKIKGFAAKLFLSYALIIISSFVLTAFFTGKNLENRFLQDIKSSLVKQAGLMEAMASPFVGENTAPVRLQELAASMSQISGCRVTLIEKDGTVSADSEKDTDGVRQMENHLYRPEIRKAFAGDIGIDTRRSPTLGMEMLYVAVPVRYNGVIKGVLRCALSLESVENKLAHVRNINISGLFFAILLALVVGGVLAARTTMPINRMIQASRRFSEGDFSRRIMHISKDEIGDLALTLNKMAQSIEDKISEIKSQNKKLSAVFGSMVEGVIIVDPQSRVVSINRAIEKTFGVSAKDCAGSTLVELIRNHELAGVVEDVLARGDPRTIETEMTYPARRNLEINAVPIISDGRTSGCLAVVHDITEIRRLETVRRDFIANAAHELKTPLTSIKGFVETLLDGALEDRENSSVFLKIIAEHTDRLDALVQDLLALSHLESNEITLRKSDVDLSGLADETLLGFGSQLKKKNISAANKIGKGVRLKADRERIGRVLTNLIDNAIKFNADGGRIILSAVESPGCTKVVVEDSGIGIPEKDLPRIFERFYRVDKARSRELGGTGLGLSIVKHIVDLHEGSVGVESTDGAGSAFWFSVPK